MLDEGCVHGIARYTHNLIHWGLRHRPQHQLVVATRKPERWRETTEEFPQLSTVAMGSAPFTWREHLAWPRVLRGVDLAHFTSLAAPVYSPCRYVMTVHDIIPWHFPTRKMHRPYLATIGRWCLSRAKALVCGSHYTVSDLERTFGVPPRRVRVIHMGGLDGAAMGEDPQPSETGSRPYLLCVSNPKVHKNVDVLLRAYAQLEAYCDLVLVCSSSPAIEAALGHFKGLRRRSGLSDAQLRALYAGAAAVVIPSLYEGFGIPALEAMQLGAPVISSSAASLPEVVGEGGLYFDPRDPAQLALRCRQLLSSPELREQLKEKGRRQAQLFSWQKSAAQHWELYEQLASSRQA